MDDYSDRRKFILNTGMKNGSKISKKGWIIIGILVVVVIVIVFVIGRQAGERNAITQNKTGVSSLNPAIQNRLSEEKLNPEQRKLQEEAQKKPDQKDEEDAPQKAAVPASNWFNTVKGLFSDYGVQFMALIVSVIGVILAISGFSLSGKKKQKFLKKYFHEIDDAYSAFKMKGKRCEAELYRLQDLIEHELKEGTIDENTFQLLEKRIEKYLKEIKEQEG